MDKYQRVGVVALIKREDGKYLIIRRSKINDFRPNVYDLPGGEVEFGEDPNIALVREILEETLLKVEVLRPIFIASEFQNEIRHQIWIIYECKYIEGEVKLNPDEHNEFVWADARDLENFNKIIFLDDLYKKVLSK